eukprot:3735322-Amphidinium_carterae.1
MGGSSAKVSAAHVVRYDFATITIESLHRIEIPFVFEIGVRGDDTQVSTHLSKHLHSKDHDVWPSPSRP